MFLTKKDKTPKQVRPDNALHCVGDTLPLAMRFATATLAICEPPKLILRVGEPQRRIALGLRPNFIQKRVAFLKESRIEPRAK